MSFWNVAIVVFLRQITYFIGFLTKSWKLIYLEQSDQMPKFPDENFALFCYKFKALTGFYLTFPECS